MRAIKFAPACLLFLGLTGCVPSLHPLFSGREVVQDPALVGTWVDEHGKDTWTLQTAADKAYDVVYTQNEHPAKFKIHLVKLGKSLFVDFYPQEPDFGNGFYNGHLLPVHTFGKIQMEGDVLHLTMLDPDWLKEMVDQKRIRISNEIIDDALVLTAPTEDLQKLVSAWAENEKAFSNRSDWRRKK